MQGCEVGTGFTRSKKQKKCACSQISLSTRLLIRLFRNKEVGLEIFLEMDYLNSTAVFWIFLAYKYINVWFYIVCQAKNEQKRKELEKKRRKTWNIQYDASQSFSTATKLSLPLLHKCYYFSEKVSYRLYFSTHHFPSPLSQITK